MPAVSTPQPQPSDYHLQKPSVPRWLLSPELIRILLHPAPPQRLPASLI